MSARAVRPHRVGRRRAVLVGVASLAVVAVGGGIAVATSASSPVLASLSVHPRTVSATGGRVTISVVAARAAVCVVASSPSIRGLPRTLGCATGVASTIVQVPPNLTLATRRFEILARATNGTATSALAHRWLTQPAVRRTPVVVTCTGAAAIRPAYYLLACADANAYWKGAKWTTWAHTALGHGTLVVNDCTPNCAAGRLRSYAMTVLLNRYLVVAPYGPLYRMATIRYTVSGKPKTYTAALPT